MIITEFKAATIQLEELNEFIKDWTYYVSDNYEIASMAVDGGFVTLVYRHTYSDYGTIQEK